VNCLTKKILLSVKQHCIICDVDEKKLIKDIEDSTNSDWLREVQNKHDDKKLYNLIRKQDAYISLLCRILNKFLVTKKDKVKMKIIENDLILTRKK
jgi:hypothetical protein